jgi:hypothetical protein
MNFPETFLIRQWTTLENLFKTEDRCEYTENITLLCELAELNVASLIKIGNAGHIQRMGFKAMKLIICLGILSHKRQTM